MSNSTNLTQTLTLFSIEPTDVEQETIFHEIVEAAPIEQVFPTDQARKENKVIVLNAQRVSLLPAESSALEGGVVYLPLHRYEENEEEPKPKRIYNVTDWAVEQFRQHYADVIICQSDIFYYIFAMLHHPALQAETFKNHETAEIPLAAEFWKISDAGRALAALHMAVTDPTEIKSEAEKIASTLPDLPRA